MGRYKPFLLLLRAPRSKQIVARLNAFYVNDLWRMLLLLPRQDLSKNGTFNASNLASKFWSNFHIYQLKHEICIPQTDCTVVSQKFSVTRLGNILDFGQLLKPLATTNLPKSSTFIGNFCKGVRNLSLF